ncbi:L-asparaginase [Phytohabitans aurantiacus]|uniref:L-asparaginase n=1 Tax=Phytohabitans aurantiacus TaxID=3016789 RepID=A0ABQ5QQL6_9ACTN|nr:L-asparaginase [Phytohabitans aurantiacus]
MLVVSLGGTITMTPIATGGVAPALSVDQLIAGVPGLAELDADLEAVDFRQLPGASVSFDDVAGLADLVRRNLAAGVDGVVVIQGTDTIEETSYLLDLYHSGPEPIVVTGAMRNAAMAGADGPANLLGAVQVAASPAARDLGCVVVFADEIHAARRVRKTHSTAGSTFRSPNGGPLGYVVEGQPRMLIERLSRTPAFRPGGSRPTVAVVTVTLDDDGAVLDGLGSRVDGVILAAFGAGHVPQAMVPALQYLVEAVPVVLASRTGAGPVLTGTYGFPGSERDLVARGLIPAGFLDPFKARVLLRVLLAAGTDRDGIRAAFTAAG